ncbi:response regulator [Salipaludibacillus sp. HK11]|uniref:response regulator n=1 Tax=Salipaludibacillus sp. HK11 TaxID=3394320 RepID=UPI0039FC76AF
MTMIKTMLVDDEPIEREGLRLLLERNRGNVEVVAEAENGQEAIDLALIYKPDVIFMDIKMPEVNGVNAVKEILSALPMTKCIMMTAFDTFEYAREVMKQGVKEYLLKPSKRPEVLAAFDRMVDEIEEDQKIEAEKVELIQRLEKVGSFVESKFIISLMMDYVQDSSMDEWSEWLDLDGEKGCVVVFSFESDQSHPSSTEKAEWYEVLKDSIHGHMHQSLVGPLIRFHVPVFILYERDVGGEQPVREDDVRKIIHLFQSKVPSCKLFAGVGTVISEFTQFSRSYGEATYALELVYNQPSASYMIYDKRIKQKRNELLPFEKEKALLEAVKQGHLQKGMRLFDSYFQSINEACDDHLHTVKRSMEEFFIVLTRKMRELGIEDNIQLQFQQLETPMQVKESAKVYLADVINRIGTWRLNDMKGVLEKAKDYIDSHYHRSVTLEEVAEEVDLSFYYLSKLFKDRFQLTFSEYLTQVRMEKAKDFLLDYTIPLKEIAIDIGYKDPNYFSRVFKRETGLNPSEYREKLKQ